MFRNRMHEYGKGYRWMLLLCLLVCNVAVADKTSDLLPQDQAYRLQPARAWI